MNDKEVKKFYNSKLWKSKRLEILERDIHECQDCRARLKKAYENGVKLYGSSAKIRKAYEVHHIKELKEYPQLGLENDNLISLCTQCHNLRHGRNKNKFVRKKRINEERW